MFIEMIVSAIAIDSKDNAPVIILKEKDGSKTLPIWIGLLEASAIATQLEGVKMSRPMTHDLFVSAIAGMSGEITRIEINNMIENVYHASIHLKRDSNYIEIDARPSDAIAISLRVGMDIFVSEKVLEKSKEISSPENLIKSTDLKEIKEKLLKDIPEEEFNKYKI